MRLNRPTTQTCSPSRGGFTIIELLVTIGAIALLIGLLIVGLQKGMLLAKGSADQQTARSIKLAIDQFKQNFGFVPPLVKDVKYSMWLEDHPLIPGEKRVAVYLPRRTDTGGFNKDWKDLRGDDITTENDPDKRYSTASLAYYLVGVLDTPVNSSVKIPIDGVQGPGFVTPLVDGAFKVPAALKDPNQKPVSKRTGRVFQSMVDVGRSGLRVYRDTTDATGAKIELQDRTGTAFRYYRWKQGERGQTSGAIKIKDVKDLNVPAVVGDPAENPLLREADFAVVGAGPNGVFGDEPLSVITDKLGLGADYGESRARQLAREDNVVEVGR